MRPETAGAAAGGRPVDESAPAECFHIADPADLRIAVARTLRLELLRGGSEVDRSMIATIVSELGTNIVKYAGRGTVQIRRLEGDEGVDIEVRAEDHGPGIPDVPLALQEHYSTGGTLGLGLSGVQRMADEFWIRSKVNAGTCVFARKRISGRAARSLRANPGAVPGESGARWDAHGSVRAHPGHARGGDAALVIECDGGILLAILDAAGHGPRAQAVAEQAVALIQQQASRDLARLMSALHGSLQGSPGAAAGLLFVDVEAASFQYLGVGNTRAARFGTRAWRGVSRDGLLGGRLPSPFTQTEALDPGDMLLLWTDGLPEFESARLAQSLAFRSAAEITHRLLNELARPHDDASCLVLKWRA